MPTSYHGYITDVITEIRKLQPQSVLDIGIGFGKWGHLFREYLDVMNGRVFKSDWQIQIDGIEIFEPYITEHQRETYSNIHIGNVVDVIDSLGNYDVVFISDVIEHIPKLQAMDLVTRIKSRCKIFIALVPMGEVWLNSQGSLYGNDAEAHISAWYEPDFVPYITETIYLCNKKPINMYVIKGDL